MSMYTDTRAYVRCQSGKTPDFETTSGVLQGDTLAPYLFAICMDYVMRASLQDSDAYTVRRRMSSRYPAVKLPILAYADDAALLSDDASAAQSQLARFETVSKSVGLHLNATKTEVMYVGAEPVPIKSITGATLSTCSDFTYLGNAIANSHTGFKKRRQLAWVAARKLLIIWESSASDAVKIQLFTACVETVLLYSSEAWTITDQMKDAIDAAHRALLRYALNIRYPTRCSNLALQHRSLLPPATTTIRRKRLSLAGHFLRRPDTPLAVLLGLKNQPTEPYRRGGALRRTYVEQLREDLAAVSLSFERASAVAQSRPTWKRLTETVR